MIYDYDLCSQISIFITIFNFNRNINRNSVLFNEAIVIPHIKGKKRLPLFQKT